jgi:hypothetical protein
MDWSTVISTVVGVIAGGLVNAYFSWQGSKELRREAGNLRQLTKKLMLMMHDAELIKVEWDAERELETARARGEVLRRLEHDRDALMDS